MKIGNNQRTVDLFLVPMQLGRSSGTNNDIGSGSDSGDGDDDGGGNGDGNYIWKANAPDQLQTSWSNH